MDAGCLNYDSALEKDFLMRRWILTENLDREKGNPFDAFLVGRLCFNADIISRVKVRFERKPDLGEIVLVTDCGAYTAHFYAANTNSFPRPSRVICYGDGSISYIKKKDTYDDIFSLLLCSVISYFESASYLSEDAKDSCYQLNIKSK